MATNRSYEINFTDPSKDHFLVVPYTTDGPLTPTSTTLAPSAVAAHTTLYLVGKGKPEYGELMAENLVHMLEHFAGPAEPTYPIQGQIWYYIDNDNNASYVDKAGILKLHDGDSFTSIAHSIEFGSEPANPISGQLWYNSSVPQLMVWDGTAWTSVADRYVRLDGTSSMAGTLDLNNNKIINLTDPTDPQDAATRSYVISYVDSQIQTVNDAVEINYNNTAFTHDNLNVTDVKDALDTLSVRTDFVRTTGGTITGVLTMSDTLDMDTNTIVNVANPSSSQDAATKDYVDSATTGIGGDGVLDGASITDGDGDGYGTLQLTTTNADVYSPSTEVALMGHEHIASEVLYQNTSEYLDDVIDRLETDKAPKTNPTFGGSTVTIEPGTDLVVSTNPTSPDHAATKSYVDRNAGGTSSIARNLESSTGTTTFTAPEYVVGTNRLWVFVNGQKYYASARGYQPVLFDSFISLSENSGLNDDTQGYQTVVLSPNVYDGTLSTGLADDTTTYTADVSVNGNAAVTISVEGQNAQTYNDLLNVINNTLSGTPEITEITTVADSSGSLNNTWFSLNAPATDGYVWYNVDGTGVDPQPIGKDIGIQVNISANDTADTVASQTQLAINGRISFQASVSSNVVTITNANGGPAPDATDNSTGFTFNVTQQGSGGASSSLTNLGNLRITSNTDGPSSTISITDNNLFSSLTEYDSINTAVAGTTTTYSAGLTIDGSISESVSFSGDNAQTFGEVIRQLNNGLTSSHAAIVNGDIYVVSDTYGSGSTVSIDTDDLFQHLTSFDSIGTAVAGFNEAYEEQGKTGDTSTSVVFTSTVPSGSKVEFIVFS